MGNSKSTGRSCTQKLLGREKSSLHYLQLCVLKKVMVCQRILMIPIHKIINDVDNVVHAFHSSFRKFRF